MKNSLFKRAIAAFATVPLALTQSLGVASAVTIDESALSLKETGSVTADNSNDKTITLTGKGGALYIAPDEELAKYELQADGTTFIQDSVWNVRAYTVLSNFGQKSGKINMTRVYEEALKKAGKYEESLKMVIDKLGDFTYSVDSDGNITIEGSISDVTADFATKGNKTLGGALKEISEKYNVPELKNDIALFNNIKVGGKGKLYINAGALQSDTTVGIKFSFTDLDGKVWNGADIINYVNNCFEAWRTAAKKTVDKYADSIDVQDAYNIIDQRIDFYTNKVNWGKAKVAAYTEGDFSFTADTASNAIAKLKERLEKTKIAKYKQYTKYKAAIPDSGEDAATRNWANRVFNAFLKAVKNHAAPYTVDFTIDDAGKEVDRITDITAVLTNGKQGTATFVYPDDEFNEVVSYFETAYPEYEVLKSYKEATVDVDYSNLFSDAASNANVGLEYVRVVEVAPKETTTTTTTTTENPIETTTTTTDEENPDVTTTTTTDEENPDVTTIDTSVSTDVTTVSGDVTTVSTDVTTEEPISDETTTTTEEPISDETTTTTEEPISDETTTTTEEPISDETTTTDGGGIVEPGGVYAVATAAVVDGYYFSHDSRPFDKGHVEGAISIVDVDEDGVESEPVPMDMSKVTFKEVNSGADNPAGAFKGPNSLTAYTIDDFRYEVQVFYNGELLKYKDGTPVTFRAFIGVKGDANFDMAVDATDASSVLSFYAKASTINSQLSDEERAAAKSAIRLAPRTCTIVDDEPMLDELAAFLVDVDRDVYSDDNWKLRKADSDRVIDSPDASNILSFYSKYSTIPDAEKATADRQELWNRAISGREEQMKAFLAD